MELTRPKANWLLLAVAVLVSCEAEHRPATVMPSQSAARTMPGLCSEPAPRGPYDYGCYLSAIQTLGQVTDRPIYWHIYTFPSHEAADAAKSEHSVAVEAFGRIWLYTMAPKDWRPSAGNRMGVIGPLDTKADIHYTARYMEATFPPGRNTTVHIHPGPEAWYVLSGAQCLRTPERTIIAHAGEGTFVPEGSPMILSSIGNDTRRAVFVVLHDSNRPWQTNHGGWHPNRNCEDHASGS
jgi:quercetin dioxygenase-like cupin family protein